MKAKTDQQEMEIRAIRRMERILDELPARRRFTIIDFVRGRLVEEARLAEASNGAHPVVDAGEDED